MVRVGRLICGRKQSLPFYILILWLGHWVSKEKERKKKRKKTVLTNREMTHGFQIYHFTAFESKFIQQDFLKSWKPLLRVGIIRWFTVIYSYIPHICLTVLWKRCPCTIVIIFFYARFKLPLFQNSNLQISAVVFK